MSNRQNCLARARLYTVLTPQKNVFLIEVHNRVHNTCLNYVQILVKHTEDRESSRVADKRVPRF